MFGQKVKITITDEAGSIVLENDTLRIDFDVRYLDGFSRAHFKIFNLEPEVIRNISSGDCTVKLETALVLPTEGNNNDYVVLASGIKVSNVVDTTVVPDTVTDIYGYSYLKFDFMDSRLDITVSKPSLENIIKRLFNEVGFKGILTYKYFPNEVIFHVPPGTRKFQGSLTEILAGLGKQYNFKVFTVGDDITLAYKANAKNVDLTDFDSEIPIKLDTRNMRAMPTLGPASLQITSNLDPNIVPTSVLDISDLTTAGANISPDQAEFAKGFITDTIGGWSKYQVLQVQHKGSNFTAEWMTAAVAYSPEDHVRPSSDRWFL
jgi:hypothetical protein